MFQVIALTSSFLVIVGSSSMATVCAGSLALMDAGERLRAWTIKQTFCNLKLVCVA